MSTLLITIFTGAYPDINTPIEIRIYRQSDASAVIASLRLDHPHPAGRMWSFPGLPRTNLLFRIFQMQDMVSNTILQQLDEDMDVIPGDNPALQYKAPVQVEADVTAGFASGVNTATFSDWIGWDIATIDRLGAGPMKRGIDYSYDSSTGLLTLLAAGDVFGENEWFEVTFKPNSVAGVDSVGQPDFFGGAKLITGDYAVSAGDDFGNKKVLILDPAGVSLNLTLPDISTVPPNRMVTVEMRKVAPDVFKCSRIVCTGTDTIDWQYGRPDLYILPNESISFYRFEDTTDPSNPVNFWRVYNPQGNFLSVGNIIQNNSIYQNLFNSIPPDGRICDIVSFGRLYNDFVLNLPGIYVVNFDDWGTGNNKYKFSLANSSDPANAGKFHIPDFRGMYERNTDGLRVPGDFKAGVVAPHRHNAWVDSTETTNDFPYEHGADLSKTRSPLKGWSKSGSGKESYYMDGGIAEPTIGRTSLPTDAASGNLLSTTENSVSDIAVNKFLLL